MTYAHNGIELKAIPGIPQPEVKPEEKKKEDAVADGSPERRERPRVLSQKTSNFLRALGDKLEKAKPLNPRKLTIAGTLPR
jgi:penicillin-binding protein 1A